MADKTERIGNALLALLFTAAGALVCVALAAVVTVTPHGWLLAGLLALVWLGWYLALSDG